MSSFILLFLPHMIDQHVPPVNSPALAEALLIELLLWHVLRLVLRRVARVGRRNGGGFLVQREQVLLLGTAVDPGIHGPFRPLKEGGSDGPGIVFHAMQPQCAMGIWCLGGELWMVLVLHLDSPEKQNLANKLNQGQQPRFILVLALTTRRRKKKST